jgi:peptidylprolyl isomerase
MNARVLAALVAAGTMVLAACSPSLEEPSDKPPGYEPELRIDAPSSSAPHAEEHGKECTIADFKVEGASGERPKIELPKESCTPPAKPLTDELDAGEGAAAKEGDTVTVNYVIAGVSSAKKDSTWSSATQSEPEQIVLGEADLGWDEHVVGMKLGARKLVVLSAADLPDAEKQGFEPDEALALVIGRTA